MTTILAIVGAVGVVCAIAGVGYITDIFDDEVVDGGRKAKEGKPVTVGQGLAYLATALRSSVFIAAFIWGCVSMIKFFA